MRLFRQVKVILIERSVENNGSGEARHKNRTCPIFLEHVEIFYPNFPIFHATVEEKVEESSSCAIFSIYMLLTLRYCTSVLQ